ncbi:acyltransferase [Nocardia sp. NBC_01730]|uniref:acyltransferase family protein n=1 Tax=Nocardia sp. NBC_01730 TaxID=2975998 RepID=UPI002E0DD2FD|nr:acyltransferase [Nocardia sp. NBC_01730]
MTATLSIAAPATERVRSRAFVPALEGMRGMAALGVLLTHVAFQTGAAGTPVIGRVWGRFDMAVAVFFALSGFLLWRPHAAAARGLGSAPSVGYYLRHRAARILPAYWVVVCAVLVLLPSAAGTAGLRVWVSNLALLQVFVPLTLTDGLTQMWSLSVEVAFYLVLPVLAFALVRLRGSAARLRVPVILALGAISLVWNFIPVPTPDAIHADNWLPGYLPWFAAGMLLAELADTSVRLSNWWKVAANQPLMWTVASVAFLLAATDLAGPAGLARAEPWQYAVKMGLGTIIGFALLAPLVLRDPAARPHRWRLLAGRSKQHRWRLLAGRSKQHRWRLLAGRSKQHRWLESPLAATIGRWSYGIFIWHLAVLSIVFPVFGILPFQGDFCYVLILTVAITLPVASASYALVEEPVRRWARGRDRTKRAPAIEPAP